MIKRFVGFSFNSMIIILSFKKAECHSSQLFLKLTECQEYMGKAVK